jgi:hypothetical protein
VNFKSPLPLVLLLATSLNAAEPPRCEWAVAAGGTKHDKTRAINVDSTGNVVLAGEITGPAKFGAVELPGAGQMDVFVAKCSPSGEFLWARAAGGGATDRAYAVAADKAGNVYAAGHFESQDAEFDGVKVANKGGYDLFVVKYDPRGKLLWVRTAGGEGYDYAHGLSIDPQGDVVVTGAIAGDATFGEATIAAGQGRRLFCAKYSPEGRVQWITTTSGKAEGSGHGVATDGQGNIYVGGMNSGSGSFGVHALNTARGQESLVAKLSKKGEVLWVSLQKGEPSCLVHEITCDTKGNVWAAGMFKGWAYFGNDVFESSGEKDSDAFIAHYTSDGTLKWARAGKGPATDYGLGVATDGLGNSFLCGTFTDHFTIGDKALASRGSGDIYLAGFDPLGSVQWLEQAGGKGGDNAYSLVHDGKDGLVMGGAFSGSGAFGNVDIQEAGGSDLYSAKWKVPPVQSK